MPDDDRAPMDAEPLWSLPELDVDLPESLENGLITAGIAVVLPLLAFQAAAGSGLLVTLVLGFLYARILFTAIYKRA